MAINEAPDSDDLDEARSPAAQAPEQEQANEVVAEKLSRALDVEDENKLHWFQRDGLTAYLDECDLDGDPRQKTKELLDTVDTAGSFPSIVRTVASTLNLGTSTKVVPAVSREAATANTARTAARLALTKAHSDAAAAARDQQNNSDTSQKEDETRVRKDEADSETSWALRLSFLSWVIAAGLAVAAIVFRVIAISAKGLPAHPNLAKAHPPPQDWYLAATFACVCMAMAVVLLSAFFHGRYGIFGVVLSDGKASASLTQFALWTFLVASGVALFEGLGLVSGVAAAHLSNTVGDKVWPDYLVLLGGPAAAGVLAKGLVTYKVKNGTLQRTDASRPMLSQIAKDDAGQSDLVKIQYLVFNVIAMAVFVFGCYLQQKFPDIPPIILSLTGGSAALYVAGKAASANQPTITSISPLSPAQGGRLTLFGTNFDPSTVDDPARRITVSLLGHSDPLYSTKSSDTSIVVRVPFDMVEGWTKVTVTSTAGVETLPGDLQILTARTPRNAKEVASEAKAKAGSPTRGTPPQSSPATGGVPTTTVAGRAQKKKVRSLFAKEPKTSSGGELVRSGRHKH